MPADRPVRPLPTRPLIEACVTSPSEVETALAAGADRLELCRDLSTGGLTPGIDWLAETRARTDKPLMVMIRPRPGTFQMTGAEIDQMLRSIVDLQAAGADGFVLGVLDRASRIDRVVLKELVVAAGAPVTFHRAFDQVRDQVGALAGLVEAGVARVLTSGGPGTAWQGRKVLAELVAATEGQMTILAGGGVRAGHAPALVQQACLREIHARASAIPDLVRAMPQ